MGSGTIAFALGALFCHQLTELPDPFFAGISPLLLMPAAGGRRSRIAALFLLGIAWTQIHATVALSARLPAALDGQPAMVEGRVQGVVRTGARRRTFELELERVLRPARAAAWRHAGCTLQLSWFEPFPAIRSGERWRLAVRLRAVRGLRNPGGFDREHRALRDGICATGYVYAPRSARRLRPASGARLGALRTEIAQRIARHLDDEPAAGLVIALAVGLRDGVEPSQRRTLRVTGTAHLMAISGLHIGLVAAIGFALGRAPGLCCPALWRRLPARHWGALLALLLAAGYAALAGFSVPTQRALIMLAVVICALLRRRQVAAGRVLAVALAAVLALDPLAVNDPGTWLSFTAVAALLLGMASRRVRTPGVWRVASAFATAFRIQAVAWVGLAPLVLACFGAQPLVSPFANLLAVPVVGALVVPATLAGVALEPLWPTAGAALLRLAARVMQYLLAGLERLPELAWSAPGPIDWALLVLAAVCALLLLLPRALAPRRLALAWLAALVASPAHAPAQGELWLLLADVGQGLAVIVRTRTRTLVYDAGPAWDRGFDAGRAVVAPLLRREGVHRVDVLLISHEHRDHAGGAHGLADELRVARALGGESARRLGGEPCVDGLGWRWDGYRFEVLHPRRPGAGGNAASCVLRVSGPGGAVLLAGDIEARSERELVARHGGRVASEILIAPHHGSRTSSTEAFLSAAAPTLVLVSSGHRNRFGMPHAPVLARYGRHHSQVFDTACSGALRVRLSPTAAPRIDTWRHTHMRFWHTRVSGDHCSAIAAERGDAKPRSGMLRALRRLLGLPKAL